MTKVHLLITIVEIALLIGLTIFNVRMLKTAWDKYWELHDH